MRPKTLAFVLLSLMGLLAIGASILTRHTRSLKAASQARLPAGATLKTVPKFLTVRKSGDHAQFSVTVEFDYKGTPPLPLVPPLVTLQASTGNNVQPHASTSPADPAPPGTPLPADGSLPRFIGAMIPEPTLTTPGPQEFTLHYWVPASQLNHPLTLTVAGKPFRLPPPGPLGNLQEDQSRRIELRP